MNDAIIYCADCVVRYGSGIVLVMRRSDGLKLALPGGKQETAETQRLERLSDTALRELREETGLTGTIVGTLGTYADPHRDPRGVYISTVFIIDAIGHLKTPEPTKVIPFVRTESEITSKAAEFAFDHAAILDDYFRLCSS